MAGQSIIVMGVSGSGKTTVGEAVARQIHAKLLMVMIYTPAPIFRKWGVGNRLMTRTVCHG